VLYDEVLAKRLPVSRTNLGLKGKGGATFRDINGFSLSLPALVFPFRRALFWKAYEHYQEAIGSRRSHICANETCPDEETWLSIRNACMENSVCGNSLYFQYRDSDYLSETEFDEEEHDDSKQDLS
jgi:hypothetical protein